MNIESSTQEIDPRVKISKEYRENFFQYAESCLKIQTMEGELVPFEVNEIQILIERVIDHIRSEGRLVRLIILKARREGVSTYWCGKFFWRTTFNRNRHAMIITHEPEATDFLFSMCKRFLHHLPSDFVPSEKFNNTKKLEFNNDDGTGLDSAIRVGTAGKEDFASSQLIHYLLCSELAKWARHIETNLLTSVLQCVPDAPDTMIVFESTARGIGGEFYDRYWKARYLYTFYLDDNGDIQLKIEINEDAKEDNIYNDIFIPWFVFSKYQKEPPANFKPTNEEKELMELHNLQLKHVAWRRWAIENKCNGDEEKFRQEYPSTALEAFLSSGRTVFDVKKCALLKKYAPKPKQRYDIQLSTGHFLASQNKGNLKVWQEPIPKKSYIIGADVAEGLAHGDFSCADVIDRITGIQCAQWHGHIDPDLFAHVLYWLGSRYNDALLAVERNNHGLLTITSLQKLDYRNLFGEVRKEPPFKSRFRYGWLTGSSKGAGKYSIIDNLKGLMRDGTHGIQCADTFGEMMVFKEDEDGKLGAELNLFDDRVMSMAIAKWVRNIKGLPKSPPTDKRRALKKDSARKVPISAWQG